MASYTKVMVPLDGSPFAEAVLPWASAVARQAGARLTLTRVAEGAIEAEEVARYLDAKAASSGAEAQVLRSLGGVAATILAAVNAEPSTLCAITTHGRGGVLEAALGSVAREVVGGALRPAVLYRPVGGESAESAPAPWVGSIVAAVDGSEFSERVLGHAAALAQALHSRLTIVQVVAPGQVPPGADVLESSYVSGQAARLRRAHALDVDFEVLHGEAGHALLDFVRGRPGALLAMSSHARPGLARTVLGSTTMACVRHAGLPVLVLGPAGEPAATGA
jgi:nucleotide-binding universal stress UspA family protein